MESTLLEQGIELMVVGMGTVFLFLTSLIAATSLMSWLVQRLRPAAVVSDELPAEEIAAISAAIAQHRRS